MNNGTNLDKRHTDAPLAHTEHDTILQTLDRASNSVYLHREHFEPSVQAWDDVPLIFAQEHPDPNAWDRDPQAELKRIKGRLINGHASGSYIDNTGHPRLMTVLNLDDTEVEDGIAAGKISPSTGMRVPHSDKETTGPVKPHHILFFYEDGKTKPGDKGAFILNTETGNEKDAKLVARFLAFLKGEPDKSGDVLTNTKNEVETMSEIELAGKLAVSEANLKAKTLEFTQAEAKIKDLDSQISALKAERDTLKADNLTFTKARKDAEWEGMKVAHVPKGMVKDPATEAASRKLFEDTPALFLEKVLTFQDKTEADDGEGNDPLSFTATKGGVKGGKAKSYSDKLAEIGIPSVSFDAGKGGDQ